MKKLLFISLISLVLVSCKGPKMSSNSTHSKDSTIVTNTDVKKETNTSDSTVILSTSETKDSVISIPEEVSLYKINTLSDTSYSIEDSTGYSIITVDSSKKEVTVKNVKKGKTILVPKTKEVLKEIVNTKSSEKTSQDSIRSSQIKDLKSDSVSTQVEVKKPIKGIYKFSLYFTISAILLVLLYIYLRIKKFIPW